MYLAFIVFELHLLIRCCFFLLNSFTGQRVFFNGCSAVALNGEIIARGKQFALQDVVSIETKSKATQQFPIINCSSNSKLSIFVGGVHGNI